MNRRQPHRTQARQHRCLRCQHWEVRYQVAVRASCYIGHYIRQDFLVTTVLEHVAVQWCRYVEHIVDLDWDEFFDGYRADVERDVDPRALKTGHHDWEYHRVWTNHAALLRGESDQVCPRPDVWPA